MKLLDRISAAERVLMAASRSMADGTGSAMDCSVTGCVVYASAVMYQRDPEVLSLALEAVRVVLRASGLDVVVIEDVLDEWPTASSRVALLRAARDSVGVAAAVMIAGAVDAMWAARPADERVLTGGNEPGTLGRVLVLAGVI